MDINSENMRDLHRTVIGAFRDAFHKAPEVEWTKFATLIRSSSSSNLMPFLKATDGMREWLGDATFDQLASGRYAIENRKFQKGLKVERDQVKDDADGGAGLYSSLAAIHASACASHPDELVIGEVLANGETLLCHDGQPFFDNSHPNQNGDGGVQDNLIGSGGPAAWYLFDTSHPIKPLIYQLREGLTFDSLADMTSDHAFKTHEFLYNAWIRDSAGFGPWFTAVKSLSTFDETSFKAARNALEGFHMGVKDPLTGTYRSARNRAMLLVAPYSLKDTINDIFVPETIDGTTNTLRNAVPVHFSRYL